MTDDIPFLPYKLFFLYIEPISALAGAYYAAIKPDQYTALLSLNPTSHIPPTSLTTRITLIQLANLYLLFALNEHLVLSSAPPLRTWRRLLFGLLVADIGHLVSMTPLGVDVFWRVWDWNALVWGSVGFVYVGASLRIAFLAGLGLGEVNEQRIKKDV